ncbi:hypothetical protein GCM10027344_16290 [Spelaeicoccus albus]
MADPNSTDDCAHHESHAGRIRLYRIRSGLTQRQLATRAGVNESKIRQLEDHNYTDNPKLLARVAKIFDTSVHDLVE